MCVCIVMSIVHASSLVKIQTPLEANILTECYKFTALERNNKPAAYLAKDSEWNDEFQTIDLRSNKTADDR